MGAERGELRSGGGVSNRHSHGCRAEMSRAAAGDMAKGGA